jgi:hypothetical protein
MKNFHISREAYPFLAYHLAHTRYDGKDCLNYTAEAVGGRVDLYFHHHVTGNFVRTAADRAFKDLKKYKNWKKAQEENPRS